MKHKLLTTIILIIFINIIRTYVGVCSTQIITYKFKKQPCKITTDSILQKDYSYLKKTSNPNKFVLWHKSFFKWLTKPLMNGAYTEGNNLSVAPYTTFIRERNLEVNAQVQEIRNKINYPENIYKYSDFYKKLLDIANTYGTSSTSLKVCSFVYLIGLDSNGTELSQTKRNSFKNHVETNLRVINTNNSNFNTFEKQQHRAEELMQYLQAYDYLIFGTKINGDDIDYEDDIRDKLHEFTYQLYSYANNYDGALELYNNLSIMTASAIGMAAIVLHKEEAAFWRVQNKPKRWASAAHRYINTSLFKIGNEVFTFKAYGPEADVNKMAGYAEGPGYFSYCFKLAIPFFRSFNNFVNNRGGEYGTYYESLLGDWDGVKIKNYMKDPAYDRLYEWYQSILQPNGEPPTIDDTKPQYSLPIAIVGKPEFANQPYELLNFNDAVNLIPDYLAAFNHYDPKKVEPDHFFAPDAGSIILRAHSMEDGFIGKDLNTAHSLHVSCEKGTALNGRKPLDLGHEHGDATSFIITAGEDVLAIDPGYYDYENRGYINQGHHHNVITIDGEGPEYNTSTSATPIISFGSSRSFNVETSYEGATINRYFEMNTSHTYPVYTIIDKIKFNGIFGGEVKFNINGNGLTSLNSTARKVNERTVIYSYPCQKDDDSTNNWKMRVTTSMAVNNTDIDRSLTFQDGSTHATGQMSYYKFPTSNSYKYSYSGEVTETIGGEGDKRYGEHSRAYLERGVDFWQKTKFITTIQPLPCNVSDDENVPITLMIKNIAAHIIKTGGSNPQTEICMIRIDSSNSDTVTNPFQFSDSTGLLITNASYLRMTYFDNGEIIRGYCNTHCNLQDVSFRNGSYLKYNDTIYVSSTDSIDCNFRIIGKYKYDAIVSSPNGAQVTFFMPDLIQGYKMVARVGDTAILTSHHNPDSAWNVIVVELPVGISNFTLELEDPCLGSCFFPSTEQTIDTLFNFKTGTIERLGHDLDDVSGNGNLNITNGSKMSICEGMVFRNFDSIVMGECKASNSITNYPKDEFYNSSGDLPEGVTYVNTGADSLGIKRIKDPERNMIIIGNGSALVLDSGSRTLVGSYSTILIKDGGTLYVKTGATLEVGSACPYDRGEVIAEENAYFCVEEGADLHFYNDIDTLIQNPSDTIDRHIVYIRKDHNGIKHANDEVNTYGARGKFLEDSIYGDHQCLTFCNWKNVNTPYGINNREFGWSNINFPVSKWQCADTACLGSRYYINGEKSLNETQYKITTFDYDTEYHVVTWFYNYCRPDSARNGRIGDTAYVFTPSVPGYYKLGLQTFNDCTESNLISKILYVPPLPTVDFSIPSEACSGFGTVLAHGQKNSFNGLNSLKYSWNVSMIIPDSLLNVIGMDEGMCMSWEFDSIAVRDSFDFPGFYWIGGAQYIVSLTLNGWCEGNTKYDTISIPFMAKIDLSPSIQTYDNPLGPTSFKMEAISFGDTITSFKWHPTSYLNDSNSKQVIASPPASIQYILEASNGTCVDFDTVTVTHNTITIAGDDKAICATSATVLGTDFDGPLFLGFMDYIAPTDFIGIYEYYDTIVPFNKYFTTFMLKVLKGSTETYVTNNPAVLKFMAIDSIRRLIHSRPWYTDYIHDYNTLSSPTPGSTDAIHRFGNVYLPGDSLVKSLIDNLQLNWDSTNGFMEGLINAYSNWYQANNFAPTNVTWECFRDDDRCPDNSYMQNDFNPVVSPPTGRTRYKITVTDGELNIVEFDDVYVLVDTTIAPLFESSFQIDSTIYFHNLSSPMNMETATFKWHFGDGDSSSYFAPIHTFPVFNSVYYVCLTATNICGPQTACDSVFVDTISLMNSEYLGKRDNKSKPNPDVQKSQLVDLIKNASNKSVNIMIVNYPNPFSDWSVIEYYIPEMYNSATIELSSALGQKINSYTIKNDKGLLYISGQNLSEGVYYYTMVVDGIVKKCKPLVIQH